MTCRERDHEEVVVLGLGDERRVADAELFQHLLGGVGVADDDHDLPTVFFPDPRDHVACIGRTGLDLHWLQLLRFREWHRGLPRPLPGRGEDRVHMRARKNARELARAFMACVGERRILQGGIEILLAVPDQDHRRDGSRLVGRGITGEGNGDDNGQGTHANHDDRMRRMIDRRNFARLLSLATAAASAGAAPRIAAAQKRIVKPKRLAPGDTVGLVLPASATFEADDIALAREQLEAIGFKVVVGPHAYDRHGYFAGQDRDRANDVNRMFADDAIAGVVCFTGGWGAPRVLPYLDYDLIAKKPKVLIGYSDITALINAVHQRTGLVTFHGPVGGSVFDPYSLENFRRMVMTPEPAGLLTPPAKKPTELVDRTNRIVRLAPGKATGRLVGGNLTLLAALMGTPFEMETDGAIVFAEDIREEVYSVDRMLTQLALGGKFARMAGFVFGRCTDCKATAFSLEDVLRDRFGTGPAPAMSGLSFGHIEQKLTLPIGVLATMDADEGTLHIDEAAVA